MVQFRTGPRWRFRSTQVRASLCTIYMVASWQGFPRQQHTAVLLLLLLWDCDGMLRRVRLGTLMSRGTYCMSFWRKGT